MGKRHKNIKPTAEQYQNREYSWLQFNERVLDEAKNPRTPVLERLKFLAIFQSNLDEFNMIRVAGLKESVRLDLKVVDSRTRMTAEDQLKVIYQKTSKLLLETARMYRLLFEHPDLRQYQAGIFNFQQLKRAEQERVTTYFTEQILPKLEISHVTKNTKVPSLKNKGLYIGAMLADEEFLIIKLPEEAPRLFALNETQTRFILLEHLVQEHMHQVVKADLLTYSAFRVLRNYDMDLMYDGADDIIESIEAQLEKRKKGFVVGLQIESDEENRNFYIIKRLKEKLGIQDADVYEFIDTPIDMSFLFTFYHHVKKSYPEFAYEPLLPQQPKMIDLDQSFFSQLMKQDVFVHHPYESFEASVVRFLAEASTDPNVTEIHQTIYRLSPDSKVAELLKQARKNGKKVSVLVELKARFDEQNNIEFAKECEELGIEVIYSEARFKAHSKVILVVREIEDNITYFTHIGTGNYNEATATLYTDCGLFTADPIIGQDAQMYFYALKEHVRNVPLDKLVASPNKIAQKLIDMIDQEILYQQMYGDGKIIIKANSLTYQPIIDKLYDASQAGVKIDLIIRGVCCLIPELPFFSENIRVISIVGRFLEHSRIYYFHHHGDEQIYLSSADLMSRNLERRYELATPIDDSAIKIRILQELAIMLSDNVKARQLDEYGEYHLQTLIAGEPLIDSQLVLHKTMTASQLIAPIETLSFPREKPKKPANHLWENLSANIIKWFKRS
ncbi:MAG: polyphosphate kinase 1 [Culicoidibacterales bacterium]